MFRCTVLVCAALAICAAASGQSIVTGQPAAWASAEHHWHIYTAGDTLASGTYQSYEGYYLSLEPQNYALAQAGAIVTLPAAPLSMNDAGGMNLQWSSSTNQLSWTSAGPLRYPAELWVDMPAAAPVATELTVTRSVSNPILSRTGVQAVRIDVRVDAPITGNFLQVNVVNPWGTPAGLSYTVINSTGPAGFTPGDDGRSFLLTDLASLQAGQTYSFTANVLVKRSGALAKGTLYHKPESSVQYGTWTPSGTTATGITRLIDTSSQAAFFSSTTTAFSGGAGAIRQLEFDAVVEKSAKAKVSQINLMLMKERDLADQEQYRFGVDVAARGIVSVQLVAPGGQTFDLRRDYDTTNPASPSAVSSAVTWVFEQFASSLAGLTDFTPGLYRLNMRDVSGKTITATVPLAPTSMPPSTPHFERPDGFSTTDKTPTLSWQAPAGGVNGLYVNVENARREYQQLAPGKVPTSYTVPTDLAPGGYSAQAVFVIGTSGKTAGIPYNSFVGAAERTYFNVVPGPDVPQGVQSVGYAATSNLDWGTGNRQATQYARDYAELPLSQSDQHTAGLPDYGLGSGYHDILARAGAYYDAANKVHNVLHAYGYVEDPGQPVQASAQLAINKELVIARATGLAMGKAVNAGGSLSLSGLVQVSRGDGYGASGTVEAELALRILLTTTGNPVAVFDGRVIASGDLGISTTGASWASLVTAGDFDTPAMRAALGRNWSYEGGFAKLDMNDIRVPYKARVRVGQEFTVSIEFTGTIRLPNAVGAGAEVVFGEAAILFGPGAYLDSPSYAGAQLPEPTALLVLALGGMLLRRRRR